MSFNKIIIVGNLGSDPELRYTPQNTAVCNISVATNEKRRDKSGEYQDNTTWFRVTLWGKQAELASQYLTKGNSVYIEGRLQLSEWTDKDNQKRYTLEVNASDMQFIGSRGGDDNFSGSSDSENDFSGSSSDSSDDNFENNKTSAPGDDDIPF